jgi:hypothetical protein
MIQGMESVLVEGVYNLSVRPIGKRYLHIVVRQCSWHSRLIGRQGLSPVPIRQTHFVRGVLICTSCRSRELVCDLLCDVLELLLCARLAVVFS